MKSMPIWTNYNLKKRKKENIICQSKAFVLKYTFIVTLTRKFLFFWYDCNVKRNIRNARICSGQKL